MRTKHAVLAAFLPLLLAACEDEFTQDWTATPDTVELFSLSRPELIGRPSAFDFVPAPVFGTPIAVENPSATGRWDVAVVDQGNTLAFLPAGGFTGLSSRAAIAEITASTTLEELREAPGDTAQFKSTAVTARVGRIYVVRTRREECPFSSAGVRYAKLEVLEVNAPAGTLRFRVITNPYCNSRTLIPPD
jgi:hypothetical protein